MSRNIEPFIPVIAPDNDDDPLAIPPMPGSSVEERLARLDEDLTAFEQRLRA